MLIKKRDVNDHFDAKRLRVIQVQGVPASHINTPAFSASGPLLVESKARDFNLDFTADHSFSTVSRSRSLK